MPTKKSKRADGRYTAYISLGYDENGRRIRKTFYGQTQREALAKKKTYLDGLALDKDARRMTTEKWACRWLESYVSGGIRNQENNKSIVNVFIQSLGNKAKRPISEILPADIQCYAKIQSQHTKSHVSKVRRTIEAIFNTAKDNGYIAESPCQGIVWDSKKTGTREAISAEISQLISENWNLHPAGTWAMFILYAGLRPSEAFALQRNQITEDVIRVRDGSHFEHGQLVVTPNAPKSDAGIRDIPILPQLRSVISHLPQEGFVCLSASGRPVSQSAYKRNWTAFLNRLEDVYNGRDPRDGRRTDCLPANWKFLPKIDMYSLRHSFCSMLYDAGVDVKTAQYLMGHSDLEVTLKIYTHLSEQKKQRSYDSLFEYCKQIGSQNGSHDS